ncbi:MAG TPA: hypothetical protein VK919_15505 [Solirubrobacterales bacterium]|nr:hypothetical protein [Solirubrobacterales bacterium]
MAARAELIADRGESARSEEFFRSAQFYAAEGVTHTLAIAGPGSSARVPMIIRGIDGSSRTDATSPYGYPGGEVEGPPLDPEAVDWSATGLVSVFARERLAGSAWLGGARERSTVLVHDPGRRRHLRRRLGEQIRANRRAGWVVEAAPGRDVTDADRAAFERAYEETMRRAGAAPRYFFQSRYFRTVLGFERAWLVVARSPAGDAGAGAIAALSDGFLHYFLGGTADAHLDASPFKNVVDGMVALAGELDAPLNLGGGVTPGDGLEGFKRGFANAERRFSTHEVVCDPGEYERLSAGRPAGEFFPRYRAG